MKRLPVLSVLLVSLALLGGCIAGSISRSKVLAPAVTSVTPKVIADAKSDPAVNSAVLDDFQAAVTAKLWSKAVSLWPQVQASAKAGISARLAKGEIGPTVAESLLERLKQYDADILRLAPRLPATTGGAL